MNPTSLCGSTLDVVRIPGVPATTDSNVPLVGVAIEKGKRLDPPYDGGIFGNGNGSFQRRRSTDGLADVDLVFGRRQREVG